MMPTRPSKAVVVIPCHNQQVTVELCIAKLLKQTVVPCKIIVIDDHSDVPPDVGSDLVDVVRASKKGRSSTRNLGVEEALNYYADVIIFLDGDAIPSDDRFVENHLAHHVDSVFVGGTLVFGLREHIQRPIDWQDYSESGNYVPLGIRKLPSDLLTGNMDALATGAQLDYTDLRVLSGAYKAYNEATEFSEKCDLISSGMVTWSCNFSVSFTAARYIREKMVSSYGISGWFDDSLFNDGWGYEDVALGIDALFAGVEVSLRDDIGIKHFMHERSDELSSHIVGRHRIMERYRKHLATHQCDDTDMQAVLLASGYAISITAHHLNVNGRVLTLPAHVIARHGKNTLQSLGGALYVNGYIADIMRGTFRKSVLGWLLYTLSRI